MQRRRHHCNQADSNSQLADSRTPPQRSHDQFLMSGTDPPGSGHAHVYASHRSEARRAQPEPREEVRFLPGAVGAGEGAGVPRVSVVSNLAGYRGNDPPVRLRPLFPTVFNPRSTLGLREASSLISLDPPRCSAALFNMAAGGGASLRSGVNLSLGREAKRER